MKQPEGVFDLMVMKNGRLLYYQTNIYGEPPKVGSELEFLGDCFCTIKHIGSYTEGQMTTGNPVVLAQHQEQSRFAAARV